MEEAKKWVLHLEKEVLEERRNYRTLELILLGAIPDEDTKFRIYEQFIEIEFHVFEGELVGLFHRPS